MATLASWSSAARDEPVIARLMSNWIFLAGALFGASMAATGLWKGIVRRRGFYVDRWLTGWAAVGMGVFTLVVGLFVMVGSLLMFMSIRPR